MTPSIYRCSQQELYSCCLLGWTSCSENLAAFTAFKSKYDLAFVTTQLASVDDAKRLKGNQARSAQSETYRIELVALADQCRSNWQSLKRYIVEAFAPEMQKPQLEAAGQEYYTKATQNNWEAIESLNNFGETYIADNEAILASAGYMPLTFKPDFVAACTAFTAKHLQFMNQEETDEEGTQEKIEANNAIYTQLINMCLDGQEIFKNNEAKYKQFVFADILIKASSVGTAGIRGIVRDAATQLPIAGVSVTILGSSQSAITDIDGRYEIKPLAAGYYDVSFVVPNYQDIVINQHQVLTGTVSTLDVLLDKMP